MLLRLPFHFTSFCANFTVLLFIEFFFSFLREKKVKLEKTNHFSVEKLKMKVRAKESITVKTRSTIIFSMFLIGFSIATSSNHQPLEIKCRGSKCPGNNCPGSNCPVVTCHGHICLGTRHAPNPTFSSKFGPNSSGLGSVPAFQFRFGLGYHRRSSDCIKYLDSC
jgi:hypothetical protein